LPAPRPPRPLLPPRQTGGAYHSLARPLNRSANSTRRRAEADGSGGAPPTNARRRRFGP